MRSRSGGQMRECAGGALRCACLGETCCGQRVELGGCEGGIGNREESDSGALAQCNTILRRVCAGTSCTRGGWRLTLAPSSADESDQEKEQQRQSVARKIGDRKRGRARNRPCSMRAIRADTPVKYESTLRTRMNTAIDKTRCKPTRKNLSLSQK